MWACVCLHSSRDRRRWIRRIACNACARASFSGRGLDRQAEPATGLHSADQFADPLRSIVSRQRNGEVLQDEVIAIDSARFARRSGMLRTVAAVLTVAPME